MTIATTFAAGLGLFSADQTQGTELPSWSKWALFALIVAVGGLSIAVMWPVKVAFGVDPRLVLAHNEREPGIDSVRRYVIGELVAGHERNRNALKRKFRHYRLAVFALSAETAVLVLALTVKG